MGRSSTLLPIFFPSIISTIFRTPCAHSNIQSCMASSASSLSEISLPSFAVQGSVRSLLRLEGLAVAALTFVLYARTGASWWMFAALWLVPDLSMLGYLYRPCWGARIYNAVHTYVLPAVLVLFALVSRADTLLPIALIWINHIGIDRMMGYGLKYSNGFGWTHLGRLGKEKSLQA
jgi:hypothetical protein